jgi:hypothetical protein
MKVAKLAMVQIMGSMEDERIFSTMTFLKQNYRIGFMNILDLVVHMFAQLFYTIDTSPYDNDIRA